MKIKEEIRTSRVVYGRRPVEEILRHREKLVIKVLVSKDAGFSSQLKSTLSQFSSRGGKLQEIPAKEFEELLPEAVHQGILVLLKDAEPLELSSLISKSLGESGNGLLVALDHVTDPHNMGAVFRVCDACGVDGVITTSDRSAKLSSVVSKASAGASELVPWCEVTNLSRALTELKKKGFWIVSTACTEQSTSLYATPIPRPAVIVFGSEGSGVRPLTLKTSDIVVNIPMRGLVDSLNVSQAASVVLYEVYRQEQEEKKVGSKSKRNVKEE